MNKKSAGSKPEVWAGLECTINRIGDSYADQLTQSGHYTRPDDIAWFSSLGVKAIRYPVLWERHELAEGEAIDWSWTTRQITAIRDTGTQVIAELMHHGSGPPFTSLLDPAFPAQLARYALNVAKQYPWIMHYTPVNEPLTTARFSGLYGLWYPHHASDPSFARMLINQLKGVKLAMNAIRTINPDATLIQTEDLAYIHSTGMLAYQAAFENHRRWLTYDLLLGKVTPSHPLWDYLMSSGITAQDLRFFLNDPLMPGIIGWNYYVTSERYLDHRIERYPDRPPGGNGIHRYVDLEAVRIGKPCGLKTLLKDAWQRYRHPMAITEVHIGCTREEQLRWFMEVWNTCCELKDDGVEIVAVTAWALLGTFDWNSLLTRNEGCYEPGVFDIQGGSIRPTALAYLVSSLAANGTFIHPVLHRQGWWNHADTKTSAGPRPLLILTASDTYNQFIKVCAERNISRVVIDCAALDMTDLELLEKTIDHLNPIGIVYAIQSACQPDDRQKKTITTALDTPLVLASMADAYGIGFLHITAAQQILYTGDERMNNRANSFITMVMHASMLNNNANSVIVENAGDNQNANFRKLIHHALDLLLDEASGIWKMLPTGLLEPRQSPPHYIAPDCTSQAKTLTQKMEKIKHSMVGMHRNAGLYDHTMLKQLAGSIFDKLN